MANALSRLLKTMQETSCMSGPILSPDLHKEYENQIGKKYGDLQNEHFARVLAVQWLFARDTQLAAESIRQKMTPCLINPLKMLASLYDFLPVKLLVMRSYPGKVAADPFDYDISDHHGHDSAARASSR
jgi:hypothetical protein